MSAVIVNHMAATIWSAVIVTALSIAVLAWRRWHHKRAESMSALLDRQADLGDGWSICPSCSREFWQVGWSYHVACPDCRAKRV